MPAIRHHIITVLILLFSLSNASSQNSIGLFYTPSNNPINYGPAMIHGGNLVWNHRIDTTFSMNVGIGYEHLNYNFDNILFFDAPDVPYGQEFKIARFTWTLQLDAPIGRKFSFYGLIGGQSKHVLARTVTSPVDPPTEYHERFLFNVNTYTGLGLSYTRNRWSVRLEPTYIFGFWTNTVALDARYFFSQQNQALVAIGTSFRIN